MKRPLLILAAVAALGVLAGVAIAGPPSSVNDTVVTPARVPTTADLAPADLAPADSSPDTTPDSAG